MKLGDRVISIKYHVEQRLVFSQTGMRTENYLDTHFFNRDAVIVLVNRGEYELLFLDNGEKQHGLLMMN